MKATIKKWGNSPAVRIPASIMQAASLSLDAPVEIKEQGGAIVIKPVKGEYELDDLIARITPENLHKESDFGAPVGKEAL